MTKNEIRHVSAVTDAWRFCNLHRFNLRHQSGNYTVVSQKPHYCSCIIAAFYPFLQGFFKLKKRTDFIGPQIF